MGPMASSGQALAEAQELSQMLVDISERAKADFGAIACSLGLPPHLARAVALLSTPAPMRDLADQLACDRSYITSVADQLEERGLVERVPGEDRRVKLLELTDEGTRLREQLSTAVAERALVLRRLTASQRSTLRPLLEALLDDTDDPAPALPSDGHACVAG